ncbi:hypothetical protein AFLA_004900 [Aspergillus flavus NRRL3357]|nr:hypothetical protein AFLA_004900 [Aspergillus flavus NRRL3357]
MFNYRYDSPIFIGLGILAPSIYRTTPINLSATCVVPIDQGPKSTLALRPRFAKIVPVRTLFGLPRFTGELRIRDQSTAGIIQLKRPLSIGETDVFISSAWHVHTVALGPLVVPPQIA